MGEEDEDDDSEDEGAEVTDFFNGGGWISPDTWSESAFRLPVKPLETFPVFDLVDDGIDDDVDDESEYDHRPRLPYFFTK